MPKTSLLALSLTVVIITAVATLIFNSNAPKGISKTEIETVVNQARFLYSQKKAAGIDFSSGPCLSNALMPGWILDIAHSPRQKIDDLAENQCPAFIEGRATHFVEMDPAGNLIRVK